jgi:uncharacterized protein (DUF1810 family)
MSIDRFIQAQEKTYEGALAELKSGHKSGHWIWWIFPQAYGLGWSENSVYYGIADEAEAAAYLQHPVLGARYFECVREVYQQLIMSDRHPVELMGGEIDVKKLRSSLELFLRHAFAATDEKAKGSLHMMMERLLQEKLGWSRPATDGTAPFGDFRPFDPFVIPDMLNSGHVLLAGVAGSGKSLLLNSRLLPWMRSRGLHYIVCDYHGDLDPLPRSLDFCPFRKPSPDFSELAAEALKSSAVLSRADQGLSDGTEWNLILADIIARVRAGNGPVKNWFLVVDVSSHVDQLDSLWGFLPEAQAHGCTVIVCVQGAGRLPEESLRHFNVLAQFSAGFSVDIDAVASSDVPSWRQTVLGLHCGQFVLRVGSGSPRCYQIERTR